MISQERGPEIVGRASFPAPQASSLQPVAPGESPEVGSGAVGQLLVWEWRSETYAPRWNKADSEWKSSTLSSKRLLHAGKYWPGAYHVVYQHLVLMYPISLQRLFRPQSCARSCARTKVLKQQGHHWGVKCCAFSPGAVTLKRGKAQGEVLKHLNP